MINPLLTAGIFGVAIAAALCARALHRLHRECSCLQHGRECDRGLLRFYSQGFDQPLRLAQSLVLISATLLVVSIVERAHLALIALLGLLTAVSYAELYFGDAHRRRHRQALATHSSNHALIR